MSFGESLTKIRKSKGISRKDFAEQLQIPYTTLRNYETDQREPGHKLLIRMATLLSVSVDDLVGYQLETKTAPSLSDEAMKLANDFDHQMDTWGQKAVRGVADTEVARHKEEQAMREAAGLREPPRKVKMPKVKKKGIMVEIKVYDQPSAAGLGNYLDDPDFHIEQYPEYILPFGTDFGVRIDGDSMEPKILNGYTVFVKAMPMIEPGQIGIFVLNGKSYCKKLVVDHEHHQTRLVSLNPKYEDIMIQEFDSFKTLGHILGQWGPGSREDDFLDW